MAAATSGFYGRHLEFRWSANVGQSRQSHIHVGHGQKYGGTSWNRGAINHRLKVISTSGLAVVILNSDIQPTSGNVGSDRDVSGMVANVGVAVGMVLPADCV